MTQSSQISLLSTLLPTLSSTNLLCTLEIAKLLWRGCLISSGSISYVQYYDYMNMVRYNPTLETVKLQSCAIQDPVREYFHQCYRRTTTSHCYVKRSATTQQWLVAFYRVSSYDLMVTVLVAKYTLQCSYRYNLNVAAATATVEVVMGGGREGNSVRFRL